MKRFPLVIVAGLALACVTINVYFPETEIQDLSQQIEEEVQKRADQIEEETDAGDPGVPDENTSVETPDVHSSLFGLLLAATPAHAAEGVPDAEVSNPAIRKIIEARAGRVAAIISYKSRGVIGENNKALLETRELGSLSDLRQRAEVQKLVKAENADRERLFKEVAAAKNVDMSQLGRIRETYAATLRDNARPGDWIQMPDGPWQQK